MTSRIKRLAEIGSIINASLDINTVLHKALDLTTVLLDASASSILLFDEECHELIFSMVHGDKKEQLKQMHVQASQGIAGCVLSSQMAVMINDVKKDSRFSAHVDKHIDFETKNILAYPLTFGNKRLGVLEVLNKKDSGAFSEEDLHLAKILSTQIAIALHNALAHEQILKNQKLTLLGEMTASVAHEIKSPLSALKIFSSLLEEKLDRQHQMLFAGLKGAMDHLNQISSKLLNFSRKTETEKILLDIESVLEQAHQLTQHELAKNDLALEKYFDPQAVITGNPSELVQVFTNLIINACQASTPGQKIKLSSSQGLKKIEIKVEDQGAGIAPHVLPHIFESFYSTKGPKGNGLGLAISKEIIERHGGKIEVKSILGQGTTFKVILPTK